MVKFVEIRKEFLGMFKDFIDLKYWLFNLGV